MSDNTETFYEYYDLNDSYGKNNFNRFLIGDTLKGHSEYKAVRLHGITSIRKGDFDGCTGLVELRIPASVEFIHPEAFDGCPNLSLVTFDREVREIEMNMNARCSVEMSLFPPFNNFLDALSKSYGARLRTNDSRSWYDWR